MKQNTPYHNYSIYTIVSLIRKAKKGDLTEEELLTLHQWINRNPRNRALYNRLLTKDQINELEGMLAKDTLGRYTQLIERARAKKVKRLVTYTSIVAAASIIVYLLFVPLFEDSVDLNKELVSIPDVDESDMITLHTGDFREGLVVRQDSVYEVSSLLREVSTDAPQADGLEPIVIRTPIGKTMAFKLYDGSTVYLNSNSRLFFYNQDDLQGERRVQLSGEAFFEVAKDEKRPFIVENNGREIKVLGTSFNVNGYETHDKFKLGLATGRVEINIKDIGYTKVLTPGHELTYDKTKNKVVQRVQDTHRMGLWRTGIYAFEGISIAELTQDMEQMYPVHFVYEGDMPKYLFSGEISLKEDWKKVLNKLEMTNRVRFTIEGNEVTVRRHQENNVENN